jgi:hypothetical protein
MQVKERGKSTVTEWWVEIFVELHITPEKKRIAEAIGKRWGLQWTVEVDPRRRSDVRCIRSDPVRISMTPDEFVNLREEIGQRLVEALESWVSICVQCNDPELHCYYETPGAEAVL